MVYRAWHLCKFTVEFYHYYSVQNRKFIFYICLSQCLCLVVWGDIWQSSFCLAIFDGIWQMFSASFLALKRANELIFTVKVWNSLCYTWDCCWIKFCVPVSHPFSCLSVKRSNQVYPLISALLSQHISQMKIVISIQSNARKFCT